MRKTYCLLAFLLCAIVTLGQEDTLQAKELKEVIITGQYGPQSVKSSVYQVRIINNERIRLSGASSIQQVLATQLGFRFSNDNILGTSDVQLMGMSGRNVKILLDGVPLTDRGDTRESLGQIDINTIERIEIIEGPMSVSYGSDALVGVINLITKKPGQHPFFVFAKSQEETTGNEYYPLSYKGFHSQSIGFGWNRGKWNLSLGGNHNDFDGYGGDNYGRAKSWKPKEQFLANGRLGYKSHAFNIYYRLDALREEITSRGPINFDTYKAIDQEYKTNRYTHQLQSEWRASHKIFLNNFVAYTDYKRTTRTTRHDFEKNTDHLTTGTGEQDQSAFNNLVLRSTLLYKLSPVISFQPGIEINNEAASGERISGSPVITDYSFFITSEIKPSEKWSIRPGLRLIHNTDYDAPPVIPSFNAKFSATPKIDLRLAYAHGFRSPALRELYFNFQDANHNIVGNPNLKAEHSNSFSGSVAFVNSVKGNWRFTHSAGIFYNVFHDLINYAQNPANPSQFIAVNIEKFKTTGLTLENQLDHKDYKLNLGISWTGRFNQLSADEAHTDQNLPAFTWSPEINAGVIYKAEKISTTFSLFYKYTGSLPGYSVFFNNTTGRDEVGVTKISSFHWTDFTITKPLLKQFTASAGIKNLFDVTDLRNTSTISGTHSSNGPVSMSYGRSYFLGLGFNWNKN
jgi:outer membrane receptor for ferrienterochelin and colicins